MFRFLFIKMICKKKKLSLVTGTDGMFRFSNDCFCVNSHPQEQKIPSAPVTGERFLYDVIQCTSIILQQGGNGGGVRWDFLTLLKTAENPVWFARKSNLMLTGTYFLGFFCLFQMKIFNVIFPLLNSNGVPF